MGAEAGLLTLHRDVVCPVSSLAAPLLPPHYLARFAFAHAETGKKRGKKMERRAQVQCQKRVYWEAMAVGGKNCRAGSRRKRREVTASITAT
jgi:hypothetical protein